jgi:serine/threonine protein phosphatase 1
LTPSITFSDTAIKPGDILAVGDVHAKYDLLEKFVSRVRGTLAVVVFLGDILDRGGQDIQVVNRIRHMTESPEDYGLDLVMCLTGNHERMFVDAVQGPSENLYLWLQNGGNFEQFGELQEHTSWFDELPIYVTIGDTLFVHAGIIPSKDPFESVERGDVNRLLWIREPFLSIGPQFEKWNPSLKKVLFGHTPSEDSKPYTIPGGGICIDTGAFFSNVLTAYNDTQNTFYQFTLDEPVSVLPGPVQHSKPEQPERPTP